MPRRAVWVALGALAALPGCSGGGGAGTADAATRDDGGASTDGAVGPDAALPLIWIDFSITGCAAGGIALGAPDAGPAEPPCRGAAPLRLEFVPVAPAPVGVYRWEFGDGSEPDSRASPDHTFAQPGVYDVSLDAQGPGGTAGTRKDGIVLVEPAPIGQPCDADEQCDTGRCVCGAAACDGFATGFCSGACSGADPCPAGVCADLAPTSPASPEPWQDQLCLADCSTLPCPSGMLCSELQRGDGGGWVLACFPGGHLAELGASCALPSGARDDELCASGDCAAEGLRGLCAAACGPANPCPASATCATFDSGSSTCLARCDADTRCDSDPWLACQAPGGAGAKSFTVTEPISPGGYCAPKACSSPAECPQGQCVSGFCAP